MLLRINLLLLLVVAFLPFPTQLVADALHHESSERVFVTMYGLSLLAIRILRFALDAYARREHLYAPSEEGEEQQDEPRAVSTSVLSFGPCSALGPRARCSCAGSLSISGARTPVAARYQAA